MTPLQEFWHYFKRNKGAVVGLAYVVVMLIIAIFANFIAPHNPADQFRDALLAPPVWQDGGTWTHILGTDDVGRDTLSRLMFGARLSLLVGCLVVALSLVAGIILGLVAGYFGGLIDNIIMRVVDIMLALPSLLLALVLVAIFGPSIVNASLALTFVALPHYVRLTRAAVLVEVKSGTLPSAQQSVWTFLAAAWGWQRNVGGASLAERPYRASIAPRIHSLITSAGKPKREPWKG